MASFVHMLRSRRGRFRDLLPSGEEHQGCGRDEETQLVNCGPSPSQPAVLPERMSAALTVACSCLVLLGAWKPNRASAEPFFSHMASCVGEPIAAVTVPPKDQAALAAWNNIFRQGSDIKGGGAGTFVQVYGKAKGVALGALVLRRRWNRCLKMACVPSTAQQSISCQSLYFSYNPHKRTCTPEKGFCHQSMNHFRSLEDCKLACASYYSPAETGRAAIPKPQDTEIRLSILRKKNGVSATLVNSTLKVPPKKSLFFVGYLLPDPYGPLKGTVKSSAQSQGPVGTAPSNRLQESSSHLSQTVRKQLTQQHGMEMASQKFPGGGFPMNTPPSGFSVAERAPPNGPRPPYSEQLQVAKTFSSQTQTKAVDMKNVLPAMPVGPAASVAQDKRPGKLPAPPLSSGNNVLGGPPTSLPPGAVRAQVPPIGQLAMPASIPGVTSGEESPAKKLSEVPLQALPRNAPEPLSKEQTSGANVPPNPPTSMSSSEDSAESAHLNSTAEQEASSSVEKTSNSSAAVERADEHARKARSAPPSEDKLAGRVGREQPWWAVPLTRRSLSRRNVALGRSAGTKPVVEEKISVERAPHTGIGTPFAVRRNFAKPFTAANRRQRRGGRREEVRRLFRSNRGYEQL
ncbi:uncharacterized protein LOC144136252 isoform X2 [Amblyomma americanum]